MSTRPDISTIRLGTRRSPLALWQAQWVESRLQSSFPAIRVECLPMITTGDRVRGPLAPQGGKGLFVRELDEALRQGRIDCAVHSVKDIPGILAPGIAIAALSPRADPHDLLVTRGTTLMTLPTDAVVGTSSPRRRWQLAQVRPDLRWVDFRGNVATRVEKLQTGAVDATILAAAGVHRLGLQVPHATPLSMETMIPAIGQGTIAVTVRSDDEGIYRLMVAACHDAANAEVTMAERALLAAIGGDCHTPLAGHARIIGEEIELTAFLASADGARCARSVQRGPRGGGERLGAKVAEDLKSQVG
ncbi:MAG: hydroxymethylbilane synthase [Deltaproteobacteria bacterium]|nr:hydroxymethylbilane synthase [Deltaproteobacteria bacterium]